MTKADKKPPQEVPAPTPDDVLRRMLNSPPHQHKPEPKPAKDKKPAK